MNKRLITLTAISAALSTASFSAFSYEPGRKVECIAPSDPGGGWDFTCRTGGKVCPI